MSEQKDSSLPDDSSDKFLSAMKDDPEHGQYRKMAKSLIALAIVTYVKFALEAVNMATIPTVVIMILVTFGVYALLSIVGRIATSIYKRKPAQSD